MEDGVGVNVYVRRRSSADRRIPRFVEPFSPTWYINRFHYRYYRTDHPSYYSSLQVSDYFRSLGGFRRSYIRIDRGLKNYHHGSRRIVSRGFCLFSGGCRVYWSLSGFLRDIYSCGNPLCFYGLG